MQSVNTYIKKNLIKAAICFLLSTVITWWFITRSPLYINAGQKILSCSVAGGKWALQILLALFLLNNKKWVFIKNISITCLTGSVILLPYCFASSLKINSSTYFFTGSLIAAVLVMIQSYYKSVNNAGVSIKWWTGWLVCLAIAITLQLTIVFHVFR